MTMIQRMAEAMANAMGDNLSDAFANKSEWNAARGMKNGAFRDINQPWSGDYLDAARAALEAMLEPSASMKKASSKPRGPTGMCYLVSESAAIYQAMIRAALDEAPPA